MLVAQIPPVIAPPVITYLVPIQFNDFWLSHWYLNGNTNLERAVKISTNWSTNIIVTINTPHNGGTVTNQVATPLLQTNREIVLQDTNGVTYAYQDAPPPQHIRRAYVIKGIRNASTVSDLLSNGGYRVGWWCDDTNDPARFFLVDTNLVTLQVVTFTNN